MLYVASCRLQVVVVVVVVIVFVFHHYVQLRRRKPLCPYTFIPSYTHAFLLLFLRQDESYRKVEVRRIIERTEPLIRSYINRVPPVEAF